MGVIDWLGRLFKPPKAGLYHVDIYRAEAEERMAIDAYALFTVVHLIANLLSVCEYRTYRNGREVFCAEWASLNVRPNKKHISGVAKTYNDVLNLAAVSFLFLGNLLEKVKNVCHDISPI